MLKKQIQSYDPANFDNYKVYLPSQNAIASSLYYMRKIPQQVSVRSLLYTKSIIIQMYPNLDRESCLVETCEFGSEEMFLMMDKYTSEAFRRAPIVYFNNIPNYYDSREIWTIYAVFPDPDNRKSIFCGKLSYSESF